MSLCLRGAIAAKSDTPSSVLSYPTHTSTLLHTCPFQNSVDRLRGRLRAVDDQLHLVQQDDTRIPQLLLDAGVPAGQLGGGEGEVAGCCVVPELMAG